MKHILSTSVLFLIVNGELATVSFAQSVDGGYGHSIARCENNGVMTWGNNSYGPNGAGCGELGDGTGSDSPSPVQVVTGASGCATYLCNINAVAAGYYHSMALKSDNTVWTWGDNWKGQLGNNVSGFGAFQLAPVQVLTGASGCATYLCNIIAISGGETHSMALKSDNTVWTWGSGQNGRLGDNTTTTRTTPIKVLTGASGCITYLCNITAISAGGFHSLALKSDKTVWAWGANFNGQLGDNTSGTDRTTPVQVVAGTSTCTATLCNITAIEGGYGHSLALMNDGTVWAWGGGTLGELGNGAWSSSNFPVQVSGLTNVVAIAAGIGYSLALKSDNSVWAWGDNTYGQLGDNNPGVNSNVPVRVKNAAGTGWLSAIAIGSGLEWSMAIMSDKTVWTWGRQVFGSLGNNNSTGDSPLPVQAGSGGGNTLCNVTLLPIELISFTGKCSEKSIQLNWATASETNNDYFTLERAAPSNSSQGGGLEWSAIGTVKGAGNSSTVQSYSFTDQSPSLWEGRDGLLYYRLKQTDYDGRYEYSPITSVRFPCQEEEIIILPNPSPGFFSVTGVPANTELYVYTVLGEKIMEQIATSGIFTVDISDIECGIYFVNIKTEKEVYTQKIVIQK